MESQTRMDFDLERCYIAQQKIGDVALFLGVETFFWTPTDFDKAAHFAADHGIDTLIIKVFDGPNEWFGALNFDTVVSLINRAGVRVLPYGYMYGYAKGSNLSLELDLVEKYMNKYGWFMGDIETEWDGHTDWATEFNARLSNNLNIFYASVLADPQPEQNMGGVISIIAPSVNAWAPQDYDAFLNSVYRGEFDNILTMACIMPTVSFGNLPGNNPLAFVRAFPTSPVSIWEYKMATADPQLLDDIISFVKGRSTITKLTATGEVLALNEADQFQPGKSQFECGFFACAVIRSGSPPGHIPQRTVQQVIDNGEAWYAQYNGSNDISNTNGMSKEQLYALIKQMTYDYRVIDLSNRPFDYIRAWVKQGYPVIIAGPEDSFFDLLLGDVVPYPWTPTGNHIIDVTGVRSDGNFLVRDTANVTDLFNPTTLRPGPRPYDVSKMGLVSATAVVMPWLPTPPPGFDPTQEVINPTMIIPNGWTDTVVNGDPQLLNPLNKFIVRGAFRVRVLTYAGGWHEWNIPEENEHAANPLEQSNPGFGAGVMQLFKATRLEMPASLSNRIVEGWLGQELAWYIAALATDDLDLTTSQTNLGNAIKKIADLQAQLAACIAAGGPVPPDEQKAINDAVAAFETLKAYIK